MRCTVENQRPSFVMTAGFVGCPGRTENARANEARRFMSSPGVETGIGEVPVRILLRPHRRSRHLTLLGVTGSRYGFLFSIPGESERLGQVQRRLVQRQAMHGRPQIQRVALDRALSMEASEHVLAQ